MGEWVEVQGPDGAFKAYVARPSGTPKAAVVAIQEIFGVNAVMRGKADWLARESFLAIAPDLFWRIKPGIDITDQSDAEWKQAIEYMHQLDKNASVKDVQATLTHARGMGVSKPGAWDTAWAATSRSWRRAGPILTRALRIMAAASTPRWTKPAGSGSRCCCTTR